MPTTRIGSTIMLAAAVLAVMLIALGLGAIAQLTSAQTADAAVAAPLEGGAAQGSSAGGASLRIAGAASRAGEPRTLGLPTQMSESINSTTGPCTAGVVSNSSLSSSSAVPLTLPSTSTAAEPGNADCGAALYTAGGFSGTVTYPTDSAGMASQLVDVICIHTPGAVPFVTLGGTYALTIKSGTGSVLAASSYAVSAGMDCSAARRSVADAVQSFTVPADATVSYSVLVSGITAANCAISLAAYNAMQNEVHDTASSTSAYSAIVAPCGAAPFVPEAPIAALLVVSAGLGSLLYVAKRGSTSATSSRSA